MKAMENGVWRTDALPTPAFREAAERSRFRGRVSADGRSGFEPEAGRYHLYVSYACPFAHRVLLARGLMGLEGAIPLGPRPGLGRSFGLDVQRRPDGDA